MDLDLHSAKNDLGNGQMLSVLHVLDRTSYFSLLLCRKIADRQSLADQFPKTRFEMFLVLESLFEELLVLKCIRTRSSRGTEIC